MAQEFLVVRGAREHNLKNISVAIPRNRLTVITGLSGSGKSSLAFDTIYAEGQRRYVESLSAYARQFLGLMEKPDVDAIEGLSPAISIEQKTTGQNPRSTVGTVTEIYDYLRLLWARVGVPHCPNDGSPVTRQSAAQITDTDSRVAGGDPDRGAGSAGAWPQGRVPRAARRRPQARIRPGASRWPDLRSRLGAHPQPPAESRHRGRGGPARGARHRSEPAQRLHRDGAEDGGRAGGGGEVRRGQDGQRGSGPVNGVSSRNASPVPSAGCRCRSWSRGSSPSTRPSASAPTATAWAPAGRSMPISCSAIPASRFWKASFCPGASRAATCARWCCRPWRRRSSSISTRPGASTARRPSMRSCTARRAASSSRPTGRGEGASSRPNGKACSETSSDAIASPPAKGFGPPSRSS